MTANSRLGSILSFAWATLALVPAVLAGNVLVVDASGGGAYTSIQAAIAAAGDGDTILVKSGLYSGFTIDDKGVSVVADTGAVVDVLGLVRIANVSTDRDVVIAGLQLFRSQPANPEVTLQITTNLGSVRVENCRVESLGEDMYSVDMVDSADVSFARCRVASESMDFPGSAFRASGSSLALYDCLLRGADSSGAGSYIYCSPTPDGGWGAVVLNSFLFAAGSTFHGGDGGRGGSGGGLACGYGGDGGSGGHGLHNYQSVVQALDNTYHGGLPGSCAWASPPYCYDGAPGQPVSGGPLTYLPGPARSLSISNPQRENSSALIRVQGRPRDAVYLYVSDRTRFRRTVGYRGIQLTQQPPPPMFLGYIPDSGGTLTAHLTIPELGPGTESAHYFFQAAHRTPHGEWTFGSPVSLVVLDQSF